MSEYAGQLNEMLCREYGPLLSLDDMAMLLKRRRNAVEQWVGKSREPSAIAMRAARKKIGRRVYFITSEVAAILAGEATSE